METDTTKIEPEIEDTDKKPRVSGWLVIHEPKDVEKALTRMLNKILASADPIEHGGRFAALSNSWVNVRKLRLEFEELTAIKARLDELEEAKTHERT